MAGDRIGRNDKMPSDSATIAFLLFPATKLLDVAGPLQVFADARPDYRVVLTSATGGRIVTDTGVALETMPLAGAGPLDTLIVSGGDAARGAAADPVLQAALAQAVPGLRRLGSVCVGAFVLAAGGWLDGRRAVTHWEYCDRLAEGWPGVTVEPDAIFTEDRGVWTSAGVTAGIDMALAMVEADRGRAEALRMARDMVLYLKRPGGQRQFSQPLRQQMAARDARFEGLTTWIADHLSGDLSVPVLAARAGMSERSFARVFRQVMGLPPARYVEEMRVEAAAEALARGEITRKQAVAAYGFGQEERMRRAFHRCKGVAPADWMARFGTKP